MAGFASLRLVSNRDISAQRGLNDGFDDTVQGPMRGARSLMGSTPAATIARGHDSFGQDVPPSECHKYARLPCNPGLNLRAIPVQSDYAGRVTESPVL